MNTIAQALRYLADHDRPIGGQERFNAEHLHQLANEAERMIPRQAVADALAALLADLKRNADSPGCFDGDAKTPHIALALPDEPTQQQKCAELALAMGWYAVTGDVGYPPEVQARELRVTMKQPIPNPFTDHEACHALKVWLAADKKRWYDFWGHLLEPLKITREDHVRPSEEARRLLTADPAIIAEAAWRSIQDRISARRSDSLSTPTGCRSFLHSLFFLPSLNGSPSVRL